MKKLFWFICLCLISIGSLSVYALSFWPDTLFLIAESEEECQDMGGSYTQWYEETYCTTTPEMLLSEKQQRAIQIVAQRIIKIIDNDGDMYGELMNLLQWYTTLFRENQETKKLAVAMFLTTTIEWSVSTIPETCSVWYDGCNTCQVMENGELACTKMACAQMEKPMCKVYEKVITIADYTVDCVWVWPMECLLVKDGDWNSNSDWVNFYNSIEWFEYIEWYERTLLVEETHLDPNVVPADASSISWKLKEVVNITAEVPESCSVWFDGCNTCSGGGNGMMACTMMACSWEPLMPYCMDEGVDNTKATDYNSSRSNKNF